MYGYQNAMQTPSLATYFGVKSARQNDQRLDLAKQQLAMQQQKQQAAQAVAQKRQGGIAAFYEPGYVPQMKDGIEPPANPLARFQPLLQAGFSIEEVRGLAGLERQGRTDAIEQIVKSSEFTAQAAQAVEALPEEQRAAAWLEQTRQIEQAFGIDIPDEYQQYSPENLQMVMAKATPILEVFKSRQPTTGQKDALYAANGDEARAREIMAQKLKPNALVKIENSGADPIRAAEAKGIEEEFKVTARYRAELAASYQTGAVDAQKRLPILQTMKMALPNIKTGAGAEAGLTIRSALRSLGANVEGLSDAELFQGLGNQLALAQKAPGSGTMSDKDLEVYQSIVPNLGATPEANQMRIDLQIRLAERDIEVARQVSRYRRENGGSLEGVEEFISRWNEQNPFFTEEDIKAAKGQKSVQKSVVRKRYDMETGKMVPVE